MGDTITVVDICVFPFIRQFMNVDKSWFDNQNFSEVRAWLNRHIESDLFNKIIKKQKDNPYFLI